MSYQSEAQLEQQLIENLCERGYERVTIKDMDALRSVLAMALPAKARSTKNNGKIFFMNFYLFITMFGMSSRKSTKKSPIDDADS